ncbi:MAG: histidinol-phosphatase [Acutalibacteraceae bacterium]
MKCNFHTHTNYCDGKDSPEELVKAALKKGFFALGFSSHSYTDMDKSFAMNASDAEKYRTEIAALKEKYKGKIELYCGIEQDYFSEEPTDGYDYVIGSVHYDLKDGEYITVDDTAELVKNAVDRLYGGDFDALAEDYFALVTKVAEKTNADIIGHFDLVSKYSEKNGYGETPRFLAAAERAVKGLIPFGLPFEINTGAMVRGVRSVPYPSPEILKIIKKYGGEIMLSSDCHDKNYLDFAFDKAAALARNIGFTRAACIKNGKIAYTAL